MTHYDRIKRKRLGDLLVDEDLASKEAVITALHEHHQSAQPISQILLAGGELREYDLARIVVEQYQLPFVDLMSYTYHRDLIAKYPGRLLHQARIVPLQRFADVASFAVQEFPSEDVIAELKKYGGDTLFFFAALAGEVRQALQDHVPLGDDVLAAGPAAAQDVGAPIAADLAEDGAWKELFDTANESVVSDLGPDEEIDAADEGEEADDAVREDGEVPALTDEQG